MLSLSLVESKTYEGHSVFRLSSIQRCNPRIFILQMRIWCSRIDQCTSELWQLFQLSSRVLCARLISDLRFLFHLVEVLANRLVDRDESTNQNDPPSSIPPSSYPHSLSSFASKRHPPCAKSFRMCGSLPPTEMMVVTLTRLNLSISVNSTLYSFAQTPFLAVLGDLNPRPLSAKVPASSSLIPLSKRFLAKDEEVLDHRS